jgi:hypothetical protein
MASERRRRVPLIEMSGFAGRNGTNNGTPQSSNNSQMNQGVLSSTG